MKISFPRYFFIIPAIILFAILFFLAKSANESVNSRACSVKKCGVFYVCGGNNFASECRFNPMLWFIELRNKVKFPNLEVPTFDDESADSLDGAEKLNVTISAEKGAFKRNEPIKINVELKNNSFFKSSSSFLGSCAEIYKIYLNNDVAYSTDNIGCYIGSIPIPPLGKRNVTLEFDGSNLYEGIYDLKLNTEGAESNVVKLNIIESDPQVDCYKDTSNVNLNCTQIIFATNIASASSDENNKRCERIYQRFIVANNLTPIESEGTVGCRNGNPAKFVVNVPKNDAKKWTDMIEDSKGGEIFTAMHTLILPRLENPN